LASVRDAPAAAHFLVMTHSHALDYALVRALLERNDFASLGLIGSQSKAARFRSRLRRDGVAADRIARLICPIGVGGIRSKWPAAIAIAIVAQLLQRLAPAAAANSNASSPALATSCSSDCNHCQTGAALAR
jgi:xanthine dehydrogenase accessory factor